jgi:hypothetical protein
LVDPYLKTTRAKKHLDALRAELEAFRQSQAYTFAPQEDLEDGFVRFKIEYASIPNHVPLIAGDFLYCLRSSLDQVVWSLAKLSRPYPEGTQFPIFDTYNKSTIARFKQYTAGAPADAIKIIEGLQPYHGPDSAAIRSRLLWRLNMLCNIDKHRRIPVHSLVAEFRFPDTPKIAGPQIRVAQNNIVCIPMAFKDQMRLDPNVATEVVFGDMKEGVSCTIDGFERMYDFVAGKVIPRFARFFK